MLSDLETSPSTSCTFVTSRIPLKPAGVPDPPRGRRRRRFGVPHRPGGDRGDGAAGQGTGRAAAGGLSESAGGAHLLGHAGRPADAGLPARASWRSQGEPGLSEVRSFDRG